LTDKEREGRDSIVIDELLRELEELRELDRRRNAHAPGSTAHDAAMLEVDLRSRRLMDRFRDFRERREPTVGRQGKEGTRPLDARSTLAQYRESLLN
jgi:hypothetical protein